MRTWREWAASHPVRILALVVAIAIPLSAGAMENMELMGFGGRVNEVETVQTEPRAQEIEINEYQGERLGSVDDFRENSIKGVQSIDIDTYSLRVDGLVDQPTEFTYTELQGLSHIEKLVTINCVEGWSVTALWEGIPLASLLEKVAPLAEANTIIFYAHDGYTTSLPIEFILERNLIIADYINAIQLPAANGFPFQLVAEEKWGYKWIRWLTRIELSNDPTYRGYWESRGYSNQGDADGPRFGD